MKHIISAIIAILLFAIPVKAQQLTADSLYYQAFTEIADMFSGGWNLVYQLQEQQDGYIAALFSRSLESTTFVLPRLVGHGCANFVK